MEKGLGRVHSPDSRDAGYMMASFLPAPERGWRYWWANGWWGDQGQTSQCVAYSWTHWVEDGPLTYKAASVPFESPATLYHEAQTLDQWPGENYDGTSVRAGAKALQARGIVSSYHWAYDAQTVANAILTTGPVVVGTNWYTDMFYPDQDYVLKPSGSLAGGHAYVLDGVNLKTGLFRIKNSWSRNWGRNGFAYIPISDMDALLKNQGEACLAVENNVVPS